MAAKCKVCGGKRSQQQIDRMNPCCESIDCQVTYSMQSKQQIRGKKLADKAWRAETVARRKAIPKTLGKLTAEAEKEFNRFIRLRDYNNGCISCERTRQDVELAHAGMVGGAWDCGHFMGKGRKPQLRFTEVNAYKQCKKCNGGSGKYARKTETVAVAYESNLRVKLGDDVVDSLINDHSEARFRSDDLIRIKLKYKVKADELEKRINQI